MASSDDYSSVTDTAKLLSIAPSPSNRKKAKQNRNNHDSSSSSSSSTDYDEKDDRHQYKETKSSSQLSPPNPTILAKPSSPMKKKPKKKKTNNNKKADEESKKNDYSGYSSSSENSDYEFVSKDKLLMVVEDEIPARTTSPRVVRKRRGIAVRQTTTKDEENSTVVVAVRTAAVVLATASSTITNEQVKSIGGLIKHNESESFETEDTSDEFWKTGKLGIDRSPLSNETDKKKTSQRRPSNRRRWWPLRKWIFFDEDSGLGRIVSEWNRFAGEHETDVRILRSVRNQCIVESFIVFVFCGIGGIIFRTTEGAFEMFYKCGVKRVKRDFLDTLWDKRYLPEEEWKSLARTKLMGFENQLYDAYEAGVSSYSGQKGWSFFNSIIYVLTVVSTIGYGHLAPTTHFGRIATIIYSLFGIPMFLILLADYGKLFTRSIKYVWAFVRRLYYTGSCRKVRRTGPVQEVMKGMQMMYGMTRRRSKDQNMSAVPVTNIQMQIPQTASPTCTPAMSSYTIDDQFNLPISVAFVILLIYMIAGAGFFSYTENWEFLDAFYFVYISTSTIGFGDLVPKSQMVFMMVSLVYFVFGLALTSMCINVVQEKLSDSFKQATAKLGATIGFEVDDNGTPMVLQYEGTEPVEQMNVAIPSNDEVEE